MWLTQNSVSAFNCGDSRAYGFANGKLEQLTTDHSHVQDLFEQGAITREEMRTHIGRNILTSALIGSQVAEPPRLNYVELLSGQFDRLFLCTDGVTEHCDDLILGEALAEESTVATSLIRKQCLDSGARDNFTFIIADWASVNSS